MADVVILGAVRSAIGVFGGALADMPACDLASAVAHEAVARAAVAPDRIDHSVFGLVNTSAPDDLYISRIAAMAAGAPATVSGVNVNMLCGSGLQAVQQGYHALVTGSAEVVLTGGVETISRATYLLPAARFGAGVGDTTAVDLLDAALTCPFGRIKLGATAEALADAYAISRTAQDALAAESHARARAAADAGRFDAQILPLALPCGARFAADEGPRAATARMLARLPAAFRRPGTVTAGNSGAMADGAAALVLARGRRAGGRPLARILGAAQSGVAPGRMGYGPVLAVRKLCAQTGLRVADFDIVEANEAFAAQALVVAKELGLDPARTNLDGGAIAHGHPVGATGAILTVKALYALRRRGGGRALVTLCVGGGQGIALALEAA